ncbi:MAG: hypothetical protein V5A33_03030 [Halobacteriales archaeon]
MVDHSVQRMGVIEPRRAQTSHDEFRRGPASFDEVRDGATSPDDPR